FRSLVARVGTEHGENLGRILDICIKPALFVFRFENRRHTLMHFSNPAVGRHRDYRASLEHLAFRRLPLIEQSGESKQTLVAHADVQRHLRIALALPLEKSVRWNQTTSSGERCFEGGLLDQSFHAGIDHRFELFQVFGPEWNQPPLESLEAPLAVAPDHGHLLAGRDVVTRLHLKYGQLNCKPGKQVLCGLLQCISSAHNRSPGWKGWPAQRRKSHPDSW